MLNNRRYIELSKISNAALCRDLPYSNPTFLRKRGMGNTDKSFNKHAELWKERQRALLNDLPSNAVLFPEEKGATE
ncbi:TPA: hypothetical protein LUJ82_000828 [Acinetobacter baumannii]|jgi:hypothetical protein|uniref:hypothetical protein n=1 Tax=Acinetobacter TaxID=469 RepID=UPI0002CE5E78|nr:hypothetical protein [Acinetobacter baumannii]EKT7934337.1 hypothetical protein [Acinetobacter baumannii]EKT8682839.1 hypothetical protein [Acinetobacter baumannii]EKT9125658.1 hypothetical protein [Acinetobacter baumannii]EKT9294262.1 hypothetical protein [Acinetobacter baumannii]EKU3010449.1 hypothetical protein [Acinetobacter baumannii]